MAGLVVAAAAAGAWWALGPAPALPAPVVLDIAAGSSRLAIARQLAAGGVVRSAWGFAGWSWLHPGESLKAGAYRFRGGEAAPAVFTMLARGEFFTVPVTIPEGFNRFDIAAALQAHGLAGAADFLAVSADPAPIRDLDPQAVSLEGYLFPATYDFSPNATAAQIVARMVARFRQEVKREAAAGLRPPDLHRWVTLASLVEKETPDAAERALIAGVFENRLARGLPLQCDPTVVYAARLAHRYSGGLHHADMVFPSPYNTYLHPGLPPGPIANPGRAALEAAARPAASDYLYFVSTGHGSHRFATTLAQQDRNLRLYLQTLRAGRGHGGE